MTTLQLSDLDEALIDGMAPEGAPSDDDISGTFTFVDDELSAARTVSAWQPTDGNSADWVARKAQRAYRTIVELQAQRDRIVAQADAWLAAERARHDRTITWAESMLHIWLDEQIAADGSKKPRKSRDLPCGVKIKRTAGGKSLVIDDEEALVEWLDANYPECISFTPKKSDVKKLLTEDGVAVPHVTLEQSPDGFKADFDGGGA